MKNVEITSGICALRRKYTAAPTFHLTESFLLSRYTTAVTALVRQQVQHKALEPGSKSIILHVLLVCHIRTAGVMWGKVALFDLQAYYQPIRETPVWCQKSVSLVCCMTKQFAIGERNYIVVFFQLTPGEGIIGNHPCNVVPLNFWQLSETAVARFRRFDVKSKLNLPSVTQTQHAASHFVVEIYSAG